MEDRASLDYSNKWKLDEYLGVRFLSESKMLDRRTERSRILMHFVSQWLASSKGKHQYWRRLLKYIVCYCYFSRHLLSAKMGSHMHLCFLQNLWLHVEIFWRPYFSLIMSPKLRYSPIFSKPRRTQYGGYTLPLIPQTWVMVGERNSVEESTTFILTMRLAYTLHLNIPVARTFSLRS